jgi:hypothetical protein
MIQPAKSFSKAPSTLVPVAAALLALLAGLPASAQVMPDPDVEEVAKTPLRDLNIDPRDIPEPLRVAVENPYETARLIDCNAIVADIAALDQVLGADYDIAVDEEGRRINAGRIGQKMVGSMIPFRSILREVTGAASNDRALRAAYTAGMVRRSFLKGLGMGRGCEYPARPKAAEGQR